MASKKTSIEYRKEGVAKSMVIAFHINKNFEVFLRFIYAHIWNVQRKEIQELPKQPLFHRNESLNLATYQIIKKKWLTSLDFLIWKWTAIRFKITILFWYFSTITTHIWFSRAPDQRAPVSRVDKRPACLQNIVIFSMSLGVIYLE